MVRRRKRRTPPLPKPLPPAPLADADWHKFLDEIGQPPKRPAQARRRLERCLTDYRGLRRDRAKLRDARRSARYIKKLAVPLYAALTEEWRQGRWSYHPLVERAFKAYLLPEANSATDGFAILVRVHKGKSDPARDWLYRTLLDIWVDCFGGRLAASKKTATGGPCVRFIRAACALARSEVPSVGPAGRIISAVASSKSIGIVRATKGGVQSKLKNFV